MPSKDKKKSKVKKEKINEDVPLKHLEDVELSEDQVDEMLSIDFGEYKKRNLKIKREIFSNYPNFNDDTPNDAKILFMLCARILYETESIGYQEDIMLETLLDSATFFFELYTPVEIKKKEGLKYTKFILEHHDVYKSGCIDCDKYIKFRGLAANRNIEFLHSPCRIEVPDKNYDYRYIINMIKDVMLKNKEFELRAKERENIESDMEEKEYGMIRKYKYD